MGYQLETTALNYKDNYNIFDSHKRFYVKSICKRVDAVCETVEKLKVFFLGELG